MATSVPDLASLSARVDKLEKQNRLLKWVALPALLALILALALGATLYRRGILPRQEHSSFKTVDAEAFLLRDQAGNPLLRLSDEGEEGLIVRVIHRKGLALRVYDAEGKNPTDIPVPQRLESPQPPPK